MKTSDWIAIVSTIVSAVALIVSARIALIAVRIQARQSELEREQARKDAEKSLADLARDLANTVTQLGFLVPGPEQAAAQSELNGLIIAVNEMLSENAGNWYVYYSLAYAYAIIGETSKARTMFDRALTKADTKQSRTIVLTGQAWFFYNNGEIDKGRSIFSKITLENNGPDDFSRQALINLLAAQAFNEFIVGNDDASAKLFGEAWAQAKAIISKWRQEMASNTIANSLLRTFGQRPEPPKTLPKDLVRYAIELEQLQFQQVASNQQFQQPVLNQPDEPIPEVSPLQPEPKEQESQARRRRRASVSRPSDKP